MPKHPQHDLESSQSSHAKISRGLQAQHKPKVTPLLSSSGLATLHRKSIDAAAKSRTWYANVERDLAKRFSELDAELDEETILIVKDNGVVERRPAHEIAVLTDSYNSKKAKAKREYTKEYLADNEAAKGVILDALGKIKDSKLEDPMAQATLYALAETEAVMRKVELFRMFGRESLLTAMTGCVTENGTVKKTDAVAVTLVCANMPSRERPFHPSTFAAQAFETEIKAVSDTRVELEQALSSLKSESEKMRGGSGARTRIEQGLRDHENLLAHSLNDDGSIPEPELVD